MNETINTHARMKTTHCNQRILRLLFMFTILGWLEQAKIHCPLSFIKLPVFVLYVVSIFQAHAVQLCVHSKSSIDQQQSTPNISIPNLDWWSDGRFFPSYSFQRQFSFNPNHLRRSICLASFWICCFVMHKNTDSSRTHQATVVVIWSNQKGIALAFHNEED